MAVVDVAHEALIRNWSLLRQWISENREALRQQRRIESDAQEWLDNNKIKDYLLQGTKLAQAEDFLHNHGERISLSSLVWALIDASKAEQQQLEREAEERQQRELQQQIKARKAAQTITIIAVSFTLIVSAVGIFAFVQWNQANNAQKKTESAYIDVLRELCPAVDILDPTAAPGEIKVLDNEHAWKILANEGEQIFSMSRDYGDGKVIAVGHEAILSDLHKSSLFSEDRFRLAKSVK